MTTGPDATRDGMKVAAGVDVGSSSTKAVVMRDAQVLGSHVLPTGADTVASSQEALNRALAGAGCSFEDIGFVVACGYGRYRVPFANKNLTEISCHARGANYYASAVRTVLDMGGQDLKVIRCDERGRVTHFLMNDKCAAGCGRSMEVLADILSVPLGDIGPLSLQLQTVPPKVTSTCVVFARSEVMALLRRGTGRNEVIAAYCASLAHRIAGLLQRLGIERELFISGGIAKNVGVVSRLEEELNVKAVLCPEPVTVGAVGAALFARDFYRKQLQGA